MYRCLLVKFRNLGQGFGGDEPDSAPPVSSNADENKIGLDVAGDEIADALPSRGIPSCGVPSG